MTDGIQRPQRWMGVELRHLLALEAVAREESFNRAAVALGYTQSAVSQQIAALERIVGQKLIERPTGAQPMRLTRAGEILIEHAHAIGVRLAHAQAELQSLTAGELDPLRVGFPGRGVGVLMPGICRRLDSNDQDLVLRMKLVPDEAELAAMLRRGDADLAFIERPLADDEDLEKVVLMEDEYVLVVGRGTAGLAVSPTLQELASMPLIGFKGGDRCELTDFFRVHGLEPPWVVGSDDIETIYTAVTAGLGWALLPRLSTLSIGPDVHVVELNCGFPARNIVLARSRARVLSKLGQAFVCAARAEATEIDDQRPAVAS